MTTAGELEPKETDSIQGDVNVGRDGWVRSIIEMLPGTNKVDAVRLNNRPDSEDPCSHEFVAILTIQQTCISMKLTNATACRRMNSG